MSINQTLPQLVAHRGNAAEFPENTLPALRSALESGLTHVEFDVHLSADHVPVVMHDANLKRCAGIDRDGLAMTWQELSNIVVGEAERFGSRYPVHIPSLAQVVELLGLFPQAMAFVELKRASLRRFGPEQMVQTVCAALQPIAAQVVLISFDLPALTYARQYARLPTRLPIGWVLTEYNAASAIKAEATAPEYLFCDYLQLPADNSPLWRGPWQWAIYEITTRQQAGNVAKRGAQLIESMQVRHMLSELHALQTGT
ncbi:MAG: glycerophosphodiester phosphodiesterase family protein [Steroidobacteraceae bacterium]